MRNRYEYTTIVPKGDRPYIKRIFCLILCALTAALCCACGNVTKPTEASDATVAATEAAESDRSSAVKSFMESFDDTPTVGDKVIYVDANMTVTVHGINYAPIAGPELHLSISNSFGKDITVQSPYAIVNGSMLTPELSLDVPSGKTRNGNMTLRYTGLAYSDITCIRSIEFALRVVETKSYNPIMTTELITLKTSAAATPDKTQKQPEVVGQVAYDDKDIRILFKDPLAQQGKDFDGLSPLYTADGDAQLLVYIENNVTVNGCDLTSVMNRTVLPGKRAVDAVTFYRMDLDEFDIDTIDSVKMSFRIKDSETWETIGSTDMIAVKLKTEEADKTATD